MRIRPSSLDATIHSAWLLSFLAALCFTPGSTAAQRGSIAGRATDASTGQPIPFAMVQLLPADTMLSALQKFVTESDGSFSFRGVASGEYRLRLDRIGFTASLSRPIRLRDGESVREDFASTAQPVEIEGLHVVGNACYTRAHLDEIPDLAAIWKEAEKGVETHMTFIRQYRFTADLHVNSIQESHLGPPREYAKDTTVIFPLQRPVRIRMGPTSMILEPLPNEVFTSGRFGSSRTFRFRVGMPDESAILAPDFLMEYCLEDRLEISPDAAIAIHFRPVTRGRRGSVDVLGTIWIDSATYRLRSMQYEYYQGNRHSGTGAITFSDIHVPGGLVRASTTLTLSYRPTGLDGMLVPGVRSTMVMSNVRDFHFIEP